MAHMMKLKRQAVAAMVGHYERRAERDGFVRGNIDPERTGENWVEFGTRENLRPEPSNLAASLRPEPSNLAAMVRDRVTEAVERHESTSGKAIRKDANVLCDWVVTLPSDCPRDLAPKFFRATVEFVQERYGEQNVLGGFVHMDETTPHVHIPVVPERAGRLVASKVINRADLKTFHKDLSSAIEEALGVRVSIELDEGERGKKELSRLTQADYIAAQEELRRAEQEAAEAREKAVAATNELESVIGRVDAANRRLDGIESDCAAEIDRLERLRCRQEERRAEIEDIERKAQAVDAVLEPLNQGGLGQVAYAGAHRGLAEEEKRLGDEVRELEGNLGELERECQSERERGEAARARAASREREIAAARSGNRSLGERLVELVARVRERFGTRLWSVPAVALGVLRDLGMVVSDKPQPLVDALREVAGRDPEPDITPERPRSRGLRR